MRKNLLGIAVLVLLPAFARAGGYTVPNVAPDDLGMAGSRVAAQETAAAVYANPAALARLPGLNLSVGGSLIDFGSTWTDPTGTMSPGSASTLTKIVPTPSIYASYGFQLPNEMRMGVGAGVTIPFGGNVFWPDDWPGRYEIQTVERRVWGMYLTGGIELLRWLRVGGGLVWYRGTEKFTLALPTPPADTGTTLTTSGGALSYDLAAEVQPIQPLRIAIDYKHQGAMTLDGHVHFESPPAALAPEGVFDQTLSHRLTVPNVLGVGVAYQALPILTVTGGFTWTRYSTYDKDTFALSQGAPIDVQRHYADGYTYRLGAEVGPIDRIRVRAGVLRDVSPTPAEWMHSSIPDSNVWGVSAGAAYEILPKLEVAVAYFHAFFDETRTCQVAAGACQPNDAFPGIYDTHANIVSLAVTWSTDLLR